MKISMRSFLQRGGVAGLVLGAYAAVAAPKDLPNFIIYTVDDFGATDLACFGSTYYETPHIDAFCADGMKFTEAYAACTVCSPTRAAIMTGRYPGRLGLTSWLRPFGAANAKAVSELKAPTKWYTQKGVSLPPNPFWLEHSEITIPEQLKTVGYISAHVGKWHLGEEPWWPKMQGFDENYGGCDFGQPPSYFDPYERNHSGIPSLPPREAGEYLTDRESDEACSFIRRNADRPFFLNMWHYAVHTPIQAKADVTAKYQAKQPLTGQRNPKYAAMVESVDDAFGRLVATLKELGIYDRTVIFFTSDNGGVEGITDNAPFRHGKTSPYEGGHRIPQICRWPGVTEAGSVCDTPVISVDFFPTLCAAVDVDLPTDREMDGVDMMPLLQGKTIDRDAIYWHHPHFQGFWPYSAIRKGDWKLIHYYSPVQGHELYNLKKDVGEKNNLFEKLPEKAHELEAQLEAHLKEIGAKVPRIVNPDWKPKK